MTTTKSTFFNKRLILSAFFFVIFIQSFSSVSFGQRVPRKIIVPQNIENTKVYLVTVGLGEALYMRYGHTLLKVVSGDNGRQYMYNWGMFSFDDPMFAYNFYLGERTYWVGETNQRFITKLYSEYEDRNVFEQEINLTSRQKSRLIEFVNRGLDKDKMFFNYEHFTANCATKPRDFIDQALNGYLSKSLKPQVIEGLTYRDYVRENMNKPPFLGFLLDILMSSDLEKNLSKWDETFYPAKLSEHLTNLNMVDDNGAPVPGTNLLGTPRVLVKASSEHFSSKLRFIIPFTTFFFLILGGLFWRMYSLKSNFSSDRLFNLGFGWLSLIWGSFSGLMGFVMLLSWVVSTHYDMHHNVNLLVFFLFDFIYAKAGLKTIRNKTLTPFLSSKLLGIVNKTHFILLGVFILGNVFGWFVQDTSRVFLYLAPIQMLYCYVIETCIRKIR
jgi:hypothetical protein